MREAQGHGTPNDQPDEHRPDGDGHGDVRGGDERPDERDVPGHHADPDSGDGHGGRRWPEHGGPDLTFRYTAGGAAISRANATVSEPGSGAVSPTSPTS